VRRVALAALATTLACSTPPPGSEEASPLVGAWRLVQWERQTPGEPTIEPFGPAPEGQLTYTANGRVSVQLLDPDRPPFAAGEFLDSTDEEVRRAFEGYFGYFGAYTLEGDPLSDGGVVTHHVDGSAFPNYRGRDRVWSVTIRGRVLTLETHREPDDPPGPSYRVVWERARPAGGSPGAARSIAGDARTEWVSKGERPPRKVIVATTMYGLYGDHPGLDRRLADAEELIDEAAREAARSYPGAGLDLVVLTETILTASNAVPAAERAVPLAGTVLDRMGGKAAEHGAWVVVPMMLREDDGRVSNAAVLLDRVGAVAGIYRKVHPVTDYGTDVVEGGVAPGEGFPVFDTDFGRLGILICWDAVYDDGWEALARQGAEIVAFPSAAPHVARPSSFALRGDYWVVSSTPLNNASIFNPVGMVHARITEGTVLVQQIDLSHAVVHWAPGLDEGRGLAARFGDRVGYVYYESEATGLFWSNDLETPVSDMVAEAGFMEMGAYVERNRSAQDAARGGPPQEPE